MRRKKKNEKSFSRYPIRLTLVLTLAVIFSKLGEYNWFLDLFSHFKFQYILILAITAILLVLFSRIKWFLYSLILLIYLVYDTKSIWIKDDLFNAQTANIQNSAQVKEEVRILQFNVDRSNEEVNEIANQILAGAQDIDILVLLEVTDKWQVALQRVKWAFPYNIGKKIRGDREIIVLSKLLIDELEVKKISEELSAVVMRGATIDNEISFVVYGIHPPPPITPASAAMNREYLSKAAMELSKEEASHKILIGDFNNTTFSPFVQKVIEKSGLYDSNKAMGLILTWPTYLPKLMNIPIDNMLLSPNIIVNSKQLGPSLGSDHAPILTNLSFIK